MRFLVLILFFFSCLPVRPQINNSAIWASRESINDTEMLATPSDVFSNVTVVNVVDGDTFVIDLPDPIPEVLGHNLSVRIRHIDTAEMRSTGCERAMALKAKEVTSQLLQSAKKVSLKDVGRDKYFRLVAVIMADTVSVGQYLLDNKLAVPYDGDTKQKVDWCKLSKRR